MSKEEELKEIQKKLMIINVIDAPGTILLGLGLYGYFVADGNAFIDILNNKDVVLGAILIGSLIMLGCGIKMIPLLKRRSALNKEK